MKGNFSVRNFRKFVSLEIGMAFPFPVEISENSNCDFFGEWKAAFFYPLLRFSFA